MRPIAWALLAAVCAGAVRTQARAPDAAFELVWSAPAECPEQAAVAGKVRTLLSGSNAAGEPVSVTANVRRRDDGTYELGLDTVQAERSFHRAIEARSCAELADAAALVIALAVDPALSRRDPERAAPSPPRAAGSAPPPAPSAPAPSAPPPPRRAPPGPAVRGSVSDLLIGDLGTLPPPAWGGEFGIALAVMPWRTELSFLVMPERRRIIRRNPERGGDFELLAGGLRGCYLRGRRLLLGACLGLELGRLQGVGVGADRVDERLQTWFAGKAGILAIFPHGGLASGRFALEAVLPVTRPEFQLDNVGPVHQPQVVIGRASFGLEMSFP